MSLIDITRPLRPGMEVYSPEECFERDQIKQIAEHGYNLSLIKMGAHCGTHMDSPAHFIDNGLAIDTVPIDLLVGEARVMRVSDGQDFSALPGCERLLLKSSGGFSGLSEEQARLLAGSGVRLIGTERLSVAPPDREAAVHKILFLAGVWIVENLDLSSAPEGWYRLYCLPLNIEHCEGAPVRALLEAI